MTEDYKQAAVRHYSDALALKNNKQLDNSGHLIGFAAECAIKFRIESLRPDQKSPHSHLPDLLTAARKHLGSRNHYTGMYEILKNNIFASWHVNRRYYTTGSTTEEELADWFDVTKRLLASASIRMSA